MTVEQLIVELKSCPSDATVATVGGAVMGVHVQWIECGYLNSRWIDVERDAPRVRVSDAS